MTLPVLIAPEKSLKTTKRLRCEELRQKILDTEVKRRFLTV